jgi:hypothetical protein
VSRTITQVISGAIVYTIAPEAERYEEPPAVGSGPARHVIGVLRRQNVRFLTRRGESGRRGQSRRRSVERNACDATLVPGHRAPLPRHIQSPISVLSRTLGQQQIGGTK